MKLLKAGSATRSRASEFNKIRYSEPQLKIKYKEYLSLGGYGSTKLDQNQFIRIWQIRENDGLSALDISRKMKIVGEQTIRHVLRFLEREESIIKDILAGKKPSDTASRDYLKEDYKNKDQSFNSTERPTGSRTTFTNDQILFFIENCNKKSFLEISKIFIEEEGSLDANDKKDINLINERVKNLNDRLRGITYENNKTFIDSDLTIANNVNEAIKKGFIKYADGRVMKTLYSYEEKTGTEKAQELALEKAKEWLPTAKALRAKGLSQRAIARELQEKGFKVGKTSVQQYQKRGLL